MLHEYAELNANTRVVYASPYLVELWDDMLYPGNAPYQLSESQAASIGIISDDNVPLKYILSLPGKLSSPDSLPIIRTLRLAQVNPSEIESKCAPETDEIKREECKQIIIGENLFKIKEFKEIFAYFPLDTIHERKSYISNLLNALRKHGKYI